MLTTDRLILRQWRPEDLAPLSVLNADPKVMKFFPSPLTVEQTKRSMQRFSAGIEAHGFGFWAAEQRDTGELMGFIGLQHAPDDLACAPAIEIGWRLMHTFWGEGYAPEGARAVLAFAYSDLKLDSVISFTAAANKPSRRVMQKIGMWHDGAGDFEHPSVHEGSPLKSHVLYRHKTTDPIAF